jgi:activator of 2-hydroxyglutaryl-CoA dehydratase
VIVDTARWTVDAAATAKRREEIAGARLGGRAQGAMAGSTDGRTACGTGRGMSERYRVGVDIGGTFTDIVLLGADGTLHTKKISSSVGNYAQAIVEGLSELFVETGWPAA